MKLLFFFLSFISLSISTWGQIAFPEIYCNRQKVFYNKADTYFIPAEFEFKFPGKDTTYLIKEGIIEIKSYSTIEPIKFNGNSVRNNITVPAQSAKITIKKIEVWSNNKLIKTDTTQLSRLILLNNTGELTKKEAEIINDNKGVVKLNKSSALYFHIDSNDILTAEVSYTDELSDTIEEFEAILVRGKRPVSIASIKGSLSGELSDNFNSSAQPKDFILFKVKNKKGYLFSKVFLIK